MLEARCGHEKIENYQLINYREISVGFRAKLALFAHLHRGRTVTQPRTGTFQSCHRRFLTIQGIVVVDYE